jgi:hypothetical protein
MVERPEWHFQARFSSHQGHGSVGGVKGYAVAIHFPVQGSGLRPQFSDRRDAALAQAPATE